MDVIQDIINHKLMCVIMSIIESVMMVMANVDGNNNKFWKGEFDDSGTFYVTNGRIGGKGQTQPAKNLGSQERAKKELDKKVREKERKGYAKFEGVTDTKNVKTVEKVALEKIAVEQIRTKSDPSIIEVLVKDLVQKNIHSILARTDLEYDDDTGLFKTPLGFVVQESIDKARLILTTIHPLIENKDFDNSEAKTLLAEYLVLIPQKVGSKLLVSAVLPSVEAIDKQKDILDDLENSIKQVELGALEKTKNNSAKEPDHGQVFNAELSLVSDVSVIGMVKKFYNQTRKSNHASHTLEVKRVFEVSIDGMTKNFAEEGSKVGNVQQLWHGTRAANVLSILKSGLIIPPSDAGHVAGRMFGNGLYFSDQSTKSLNYSYGYWDRRKADKKCYMFIVDVAMGNPYLATCSDWELTPPAGCHSTFARAKKAGVMNNEMIVYNLNQAAPRYLVEFE